MKMTRTEQEMLREVFKLKLDILDKAIEDLADADILVTLKPLMKKPLLDEKGKYISLQNRLINANSDIF